MTKRFFERYRQKSRRLQGFDYGSEGAYFVTICCKNRESIFGEVVNGKMILNELGNIVHQEWQKTSDLRKNIAVDTFVVMPNHLHGILFIDHKIPPSTKTTPISIETNCNSFLSSKIIQPRGTSQTIGSIVRGFKIGVTKYARKHHNIFTV